MGKYMYAWIIVAVLAAVAELISPGGQQGKMTAHMRFVAGLCLMVALLPIIKDGMVLLRDLSEGSYETILPEDPPSSGHSYETYFYDHLAGMTQKGAEDWVYDRMAQVFSLDRQSCRAVVTMTSGEAGVPVIASVNICLSGKGVFANPHQIEAYVTQKLSVPCTVSVTLFE